MFVPSADLGKAATSADHDGAIMAPLFRKPGFLLARIDQIGTALHGARLPAVTLAQAEALLVLDAIGTMPQVAVARAIGLDKSTTGLVLDNLEARDLVGRSSCAEDRRRAQVSLTERGRMDISAVRAAFGILQEELLTSLDDASGERLIEMLRRIGSNPLSPAPPWQPAATLESAPSFLFRRVLQHLQGAFAAAVAPSRTTLRQFSLLYILSLRPSISQIGFARLYGLDPSTCAVILRGLAKRGLLSANPSPQDGRERIYQLTGAGHAAFLELQAMADRSERAALRGETAADIRWLIGQLRRIVAAYSDRLRFPGLLPADLGRP
jgi:DNA-binding MarR family transcriptional regulator